MTRLMKVNSIAAVIEEKHSGVYSQMWNWVGNI